MRGAVLFAAVLLSTTALRTTSALANPAGGTVSAGSASIASSGNTIIVTETSNKAVIDWQSFNIASNETTQFIQPSSSSIVLNRISNGNPSQIFGHLDANGNIIILNPSGVLFGAGSQVDVNGLIATTSNISNQAFMTNGPLSFNRPGNPAAAVVNEGTITAADAGLVGLVAPNIINNGIITANLGAVHLASADTFTVDFYGDRLLNFGVSDAVKSQLVSNNGLISAAGGKIALTAAAGNNIVNSLIEVSGKLSAPAVAQKDGKIFIYAEGSNAVKGNVIAGKGHKSGGSTVLIDGYLDASGYGAGQTGGTISVLGDNVGVMSGALIDASGDAGGGTIKIGGDFHGEGTTPTALNTYIDPNSLIMANANTSGNGGDIAVWSDDTTQFLGNILAEGGEQSGNGGYVETSGHGTLTASGYVDLTAPKGQMGTWLLDPNNITIDGGVTPAFNNSAGVTDGTQVSLSNNLVLWLDDADSTNITLTYNNGGAGTTGSGTNSANTITVASTAGLAVGARIELGGTGSDTFLASVNNTASIYTITAINGNMVTLSSNLTSTFSGNVYEGYVSQVADKSVNGADNAIQTVAADMPLWISNGQNGVGTFLFNGTSDYFNLQNPNTLPIANNGATYDTVSSSNSVAHFGWLLVSGTANYNEEVVFGYGANSGTCANSYCYTQYGGAFNSTNNVTDGVVRQFVLGVSGNAYSLYENGALNTTANLGTSTVNDGVAYIGTDLSNGYLSGTLPEMVIYSTSLSTNAQAVVSQYQSAKWGIALTGPGAIGSETGLTGAEAQQAMASTQAGAATDGYSVFAASYLTRLSQTSDIILQASNNINLDLQGNTLSLAAGKNITLTAGNQIVTDSAGEISTSQSSGTGGNITFNATNGIVFNNAFTLSSAGGNINLNNDVTLGAALTANAGSGALTFGGTVDGGYNLTASAGSFSFNGALGSGTALSSVSLTSADAMTLPSISAATILAQTTGASADITIDSGSVLTASGSGDAVTLASGQSFINNEGSDAINLTGSGRWLIYSAAPGDDTFGSLNSSNTAVWNTSYGGTITQTGDRYVFSYQPTLTFSSTSDSKTYGVNAATAVASDYSVSGIEATVDNTYLGDTAMATFSGSPDVTSPGSAPTAAVASGPYTIDITVGSLAALDGYVLGSYASSGSLTVNTAPLTVTAVSQSVVYGTVVPNGTFSYVGFVNGQDNTALTTQPTVTSTKSGIVIPGTYSNNYIPSGAADSNYDISYVDGDLTITGSVPVASATSLPNTVVVVPQNIPTYALADTASPNPAVVVNSTVVIEDTPAQETPQAKPQNSVSGYTPNGVGNMNIPTLSLFGGLLTIDPALVSKFKLGYMAK